MIKASFAQNEKVKTTESLYQWDYGQQLEIESPDLPAAYEVHFSCQGMPEAVIVPCSGGSSGIVEIPDVCLEQSSAITAWVYVIGENGARGSTQKTITIPVTARTRPGRTQNVPANVTNEYTRLISEVNDLVDDLTEGKITAENANHANTANTATSATNAGFANTAQKATNADFAESAGYATAVKINGKDAFASPTANIKQLSSSGYYCIYVINQNRDHHACVFVYWDGVNAMFCGAVDAYDVNNNPNADYLYISKYGFLTIERNGAPVETGYTLKVAKLWG